MTFTAATSIVSAWSTIEKGRAMMASLSERRRFPWRMIGWGGAVALLLLPLIAMRFTGQVNWSGFDFAFAAILMGSVGLALELAFRRSSNRAYRGGVALALAASLLLIWISGAVGIIGDERQLVNLLYLGVILIALLGAIIARFRAAGMARAMAAAALMTLLVPPVGYLALGAGDAVFAPEVPILTLVLTGMWLLSARLFKRAAA